MSLCQKELIRHSLPKRKRKRTQSLQLVLRVADVAFMMLITNC